MLLSHPSISKLRQLVEAGSTIQEAAAACGLSKAAAYRRLKALGDAVDRPRRPVTTVKERELIRKLIDASLSRRQIARLVNRSPSTVSKVAGVESFSEDGPEPPG